MFIVATTMKRESSLQPQLHCFIKRSIGVMTLWLLIAPVAMPVRVTGPSATVVEADLLVVGGGESAVAAAVQAARMGQRRIVLVNDIAWLGGEFSAEAVGAIDEWTVYQGKRTNFPRSGLFLEVLQRVRQHNLKKYGLASPGNAFCASETIEPAAAAQIFEEVIAPYREQIQVIRDHQPVKVDVAGDEPGRRIRSVTFERTDQPAGQLTVNARMTIDASDWGDVIRLSGAAYAAGVDLKSRFGEADAPAGPLSDEARNEMNPISYCLVIRETGRDSTIPRPPHYDERAFYGTTGLTAREFEQAGWPPGVWRSNAPAFVETAHVEGIYGGVSNPYTHRRLVDRRHNNLPPGSEKILLNWPTQDYPIYNFPARVAAALEAAERGASQKNIVDMTPAQRRIVFEDAKQHALGMLYYLQTKAHEKAGDFPQSFKYFELTDEFGTPDRLPFKPYVREGMRLEALYMLREQDIKQQKNADGTYPDPTWAARMVPDNVLGFQFNIDFHPTRRVFLREDRSGPWMNVQTANRNWSTHTDCAGFPFRGLVPVKIDGLLGASKNIGYSSIVSSALRLHGQMMHVGQAAGAAAVICLRDGVEPREIARSLGRVRELQLTLVAPRREGLGLSLWPYFDVKVDDRHFEAANMLAVRQIMPGEAGAQDFKAWQPVTRRELARAVARAVVSARLSREYQAPNPPFADVPATDPDFAYIGSLARWGAVDAGGNFNPDRATNWVEFHDVLNRLGLRPSPCLLTGAGRTRGAKLSLVRHELANHLWAAIKSLPERFPDATDFLKPGHDADGDGLPDLDDPLPFDRDNDNLPDLIDPQAAGR
jgi:FAD dependent oxidoreductase